MDRNRQSQATNSSGSDDITRLAVNAFVSVLVALALKTALDSFFRNAGIYNSIGAVATALMNRGWFSLIVIGQLLLFLFTLVRFYLGSFRYHQKELEITSGPSAMSIDLLGAFGVFVSFYVAGIFIKTSNLFYFGFFLIQIVDLVWFLIAGAYLNLTVGIKKVASWYVFFDTLTLIVLIVFFVLEVGWSPWPSYLPQWIALSGAFAIGIWDLIKLWPFYAGSPNWSTVLEKHTSLSEYLR